MDLSQCGLNKSAPCVSLTFYVFRKSPQPQCSTHRRGAHEQTREQREFRGGVFGDAWETNLISCSADCHIYLKIIDKNLLYATKYTLAAILYFYAFSCVKNKEIFYLKMKTMRELFLFIY